MSNTYRYELTRSDKRALAILGGRLTVGDMGKDKFRERISYLIFVRPELAHFCNFATEGRGWDISDEGRKHMAKATPKGCNFAKWAERQEEGAGKKMAAILNASGTEGGHAYLRELGI